MKITLRQLNESYAALVKLAQADFPKEHFSLSWKLSRIVRSAKTEIEALQESLNELMHTCGFEFGQSDIPVEQGREYNKQANLFMKTSHCELWGDPIRFEDIGPVVPISPFDLALLDWLIIEEQEQINTSPYFAPSVPLAKTETA
jgi:hypothetical protein